ncbi:PREDICTED: ubiquitin-conjugating enzyme E2 2-like [Camelina sativa]|uniref:Ubiquitin-conjugating enzyme E2 2-like n=1 Tax=Camelina sativa TaxID=90675 RepID=A0ABM1QR23_CAMSA|nr:PREDICTED: ubiquitin-conjugating enzyme E2 2-like [Camelina sativa]
MAHLSSSHLRSGLKDLNRDLSPNVTAVTVDDDIFRWEATLIGPVCFVTKICHPNISDNGGIYLRVLRAAYWHPMSIVLLFKRLVENLIEPEVNDEDQINENLANLYKSDRTRFEAMAREMTNQYAGRGN